MLTTHFVPLSTNPFYILEYLLLSSCTVGPLSGYFVDLLLLTIFS